MKEKSWPRSDASSRIALCTIVIDAKLGKLRHEVHEIEPAILKALANFGFGDVVPACGNSGAPPRDMKFRRGKAYVQDAHFHFFGKGMSKQVGNRAPSERRFKGEVQSLGDGALQQPLPVAPGGA